MGVVGIYTVTQAGGAIDYFVRIAAPIKEPGPTYAKTERLY
jgi:hypothetical protein